MSFLRKKFWQIPAILVIQYMFWMLFFAICRLVFLVYNQEEVRKAPWSEILLTFPEAIYVDTSITCYILAIPMLVLIATGFTGFKYGLKIIQVYSILILFLISLLTLAELPIYDEWSHKLTYKALWFLQQPSEVFHTASVTQLLLAVIGTSTLTWVGFWMYKKAMSFPSPIVKDYLSSFVFLLIAPFVVLTGIRGGYAPIPIQVSDAYFSHYNILNAASVNSTFHLVSNIIQNLEAYEPYTFLKPEDAKALTDSLHAVPQDTTIHFLTTTRPNVVLVVFEGWAADVIEALGGYSGVAPHFSKLIQQGVSFDSCYASGNLSDQGMAAVFSAFPAQPRSSIISVPNKYVHLPCINTEFKKNGYATSFLFGGQ
ncbi:MAG TPA: sulfatase-like hydrolase/transferase, partial [Flavobacteriales bacterium]|nr:sulfatase-like hydrolase/transferase [Flavobacteriales bacterium]